MKSVFVMLITFFLFDIIWIKAVAVGLYERHVPDLLLRNQSGELQANMIAGLLFYVTAIGCLYFLVVKQATTIRQAVIMGCVAGLFSYGTYALTGQALFKNWRWLLTVSDIVWGVFLCGITCGAGFFVKSRL